MAHSIALAQPSSQSWSFSQDLSDVLLSTEDIWPSLRSARIFITGGTGFIGRWLLESLRLANDTLDLDLRATILTRNPDAFADAAAHLTDYEPFEFVSGDVSSFSSPSGAYSHVIHAATEASAHLNRTNPRQMFSTIVDGTRRVLDFAVEKHVSRFLHLSSGAVYGRQPQEVTHVGEEWLGGPGCTDARNTYAEGKRAAEMFCAIYGKQFGLDISVARIFALLGPHLALDIHFAAGNFILDAIAGRPALVEGNGLACRSYLYAGDLTAWLLRMLVQAKPGVTYNVGSEESISIGELAERTSKLLGAGKFEIRGGPDAGWNPGRYVPDTTRIRRDLGVSATVGLDEAIRRTALWNGWTP